MGERTKAITKAPEAKNNSQSHKAQNSNPVQSRSVATSVDHIMFLQSTIVNQALQRLFKSGVIQAQLKIGQPNDIYEQEADRVADQVMRMPVKQRIADNSLCSIAYGHLSSSTGNKPYAIGQMLSE